MDIKDQIIEANKAYRLGQPIMTDQEFDALVEKFQGQVSEEEFDEFRNSLNEGFIDSGNKVKHKYVAGSLNKLKYEEPKNIKKFICKAVRGKLHVSAKVDGLSGIAKYVDGKLVQLATRGDGSQGEDISDKAICIKFLPQKISEKEELYIRGELVILTEDFKNVEGTASRNVVAGLINRKDWSAKDIGNVSFIAYTVLGPKYTKSEQFKLLEADGFKTSWHDELDAEIWRSEDIAEKLFDLANQGFEYEADGLVLSDTEYKNEDRYRPNLQAAFKTNLQTFETRLIDIDWGTPSKDGFLCPVASLEPVEVNGALIGKCTLHNLDFIAAKGVKIGSKVSIVRSGNVIPKLISVLESDENCVDVEYPKTCPCCGTKLIREGVNLRCTNKNCRDQVLFQVMYFIKKLDVTRCSIASLENFGIYTFDDLLAFKPEARLKMQTSLYSELLDKVFTRSKQELLAALNFKGIGETTINKLVDAFGYDNVSNKKFEGTLPSGIQDLTFQKFLDGLDDNLAIVEKIAADSRYKGKVTAPKVSKQTNGMSVCFTGKLNTIGRAEASKLAIAAGYEVLGGVSKKLTYLVTNDIESGSSKNRKAAELGTKIITEEEFLAMVKKNKAESDVSEL